MTLFRHRRNRIGFALVATSLVFTCRPGDELELTSEEVAQLLTDGSEDPCANDPEACQADLQAEPPMDLHEESEPPCSFRIADIGSTICHLAVDQKYETVFEFYVADRYRCETQDAFKKRLLAIVTCGRSMSAVTCNRRVQQKIAELSSLGVDVGSTEKKIEKRIDRCPYPRI